MASPELNLDTLDSGALMELVHAEIRKICENIADPNVKPNAKRKLVITLEVLPDETRARATVNYSTKLVMPSPKGGQAYAYIAQMENTDHLYLFPVPPAGGQPPLFTEENVKPLAGAKNA